MTNLYVTMNIEFESSIEKIISDIRNNEDAMNMISSEKDEESLVVSWHHKYGRYIRNSMGLWEGSALKKELEEMGLIHPDDMSSVLILSAIRDIKGIPRKVDEEIEKYRQFWLNNS